MLYFQYFRWFGNFPELDGVFEAIEETIMREFLIPGIFSCVCVPVFPRTALAVLVNPTRAIVLLTPSSVPAVAMPTFPPALPLLHTISIWIKIFIPFVTPFIPSTIHKPLGPFVGVFYAPTVPVVFATPPAKSILFVFIRISNEIHSRSVTELNASKE